MPKLFAIIILVWGVCLNVQVIAIDVFLPDIRSQFPAMTWSGQSGQEVGAIFQNPAFLAKTDGYQMSLNHTQPYQDFSHLILGYTQPVSHIQFGFGYSYFSSTNIPRTIINDLGKIVSTGQVQFGIHHARFTGAWLLQKDLSVGGALAWHSQNMDTQSVSHITADLGIYYAYTDTLFLGVHTQDLLRHLLSGRNTGSFSSELVIEGTYRDPEKSLSLASTFSSIMLGGEFFLGPYFSLFGHVNLRSNIVSSRHSIGTALYLLPFTLRYAYFQESVPGLQNTQHLLGIQYQFNGPGKQVEKFRIFPYFLKRLTRRLKPILKK
ncbi:MAG: hypothetical protein HRT90_08090 [Candidatus Margulisbacteria bacterium]|nr:hypothetical protein [Candidatus Margulisiibacteriota bacterium]